MCLELWISISLVYEQGKESNFPQWHSMSDTHFQVNLYLFETSSFSLSDEIGSSPLPVRSQFRYKCIWGSFVKFRFTNIKLSKHTHSIFVHAHNINAWNFFGRNTVRTETIHCHNRNVSSVEKKRYETKTQTSTFDKRSKRSIGKRSKKKNTEREYIYMWITKYISVCEIGMTRNSKQCYMQMTWHILDRNASDMALLSRREEKSSIKDVNCWPWCEWKGMSHILVNHRNVLSP